MSRSIDERIVEMRFDNKQFENGIKESLSSLLKLDEVLKTNISAKSLEDISKAANNIDISGLNKAIDTMNNRFSAFGVAAARIIENLVDGLTNGLGNAIRTTTDSIVSGGVKRAMNIENAHFQLQGLIGDEIEVQAVMSNAMDSVDGTAYAYDEAAKAASMFAASGLKAGEEMEMALKAIAGTAATTNQEYERVADVFTKIAGKGRIQGEELNQFASMGMNAAAALANYFNEVNAGTGKASDKVTESINKLTDMMAVSEYDIREMVSEGVISFDIFSEAMGETFGKHAKDANETFTGSMANIRAALARTGAMFISPLITQNGEFVKFFNAVRIKVNEFNKALGASNGLVQEWISIVKKVVVRLTEIVENFKIANVYVQKFGGGTERTIESAHKSIQKFGGGIQKVVNRDMYTPFHALVDIVHTAINVIKGLYSVIKPIGQAFKEVFINTIGANDIYKFIESIRILSENLELSSFRSQQLKDGFTGLFALAKSIVDIFVRLTKAILNINTGATKLSDLIGFMIFDIGIYMQDLSKWLDTSPKVQKAIEALASCIVSIKDTVIGFLERVTTIVGNLIYHIQHSESIHKNFYGIISNIATIFKSLSGILSGIIGLLMKLLHIERDQIIYSDDIAKSLSDIIDWLLGVINVVTGTIAEFTNWLNTSKEVEEAMYIISGAISTVIDKFIAFKQKVENAIPQSVQDAFSKFVESIKKLSDINLTDITSSISGLVAAVKDIITGKVKFEDIGGHLVNGLTIGIRQGISNVIKAAIELASTLLHTVMDYLGIHSPSTEGITIGENFIQGIVNGLKAGFDKIKGTAAGLVKSLLDGSTNGFELFKENISGLISLIGGGSLIFLLIQMGKAFTKISTGLAALFGNIGGSLSSLTGSLTSTLGSIKDVAQAYTKDLKADAFMKTAIGVSIGIGVITAALIALSKQSPDTLLAASASLSLVAYVFGETVERLMWVSSKTSTVESALNTAATGLSKSLKNLGKAVKIKAVGSAVKDFAIAIGIIIADIAAIYLLYKHDESGFVNAVGVVAGIAGFLMLMIGIMSALGQEFNKGMIAFAKVSVGVLALALAVSITIGALKDVLALNFNWGKDSDKLLLLVSLFGLVAALALAIGGASAIAGEGKIKTGPLLAMCAMIVASVWALKSVMDMRLKNDWPIKLGILAGLFAALGTLMLMVGAAANIGGGNGLKAGGTILAMCAFIVTAVAAIAILAVFPAEALKKGALALGGILLTLAAIILAASKMTNASAGAVVLGMAIIIGTIVAALAFLSFIDWTKMVPGAFSLGVVLLTIALVFSAVAGITNENAHKTVYAMVAMVGVIALALGGLTFVESWEKLLAAALAMSAVLLAVAKAFSVINNSEEASIDHVMEFILGILAVAAIGQILRMMSDLPWENMLAAGGAISAVLLAIGASFKIINSTEEIGEDKMLAFIVGVVAAGIIGLILRLFVSETPWESLLGMAASISLVLVAIGAAFAIINATKVDDGSIAAFLVGVIGVMGIAMALERLQGMAWQDLLGSAISISIVLIALSVAMVICSAAGAAVEAALLGLVALDGFILNLILVLTALGGLSRIPGFNDLLDDGGGLLSKIGKTLGNFVGSIIEGIGEGVGRALENIGLSLSKFMVNATPFFMGLKMIDDDAVKAAGALASIIIALAVAEFINGITNLMSVFMGTNDMPTFGQKLVAFGKSVAEFDEATRGVDGDNVSKVAQAAKSLIDIAKAIPNSGGLLGKVIGENDIDVFGQKLKAFAPSILEFHNKVQSISDVSSWKKVADGMKYLVDMAAYIPNSGGILENIMGNNDIDVFGQKLKAFAPSILEFHNKVQSISDVSSWRNVATGTKYLVDMAKEIPNEGGAISFFTGDNGIAEFGKSVLTFGIYISEFNKYVSNIPISTFMNISTGMTQLINMCKSLKDVDPDVMVKFSDNMAKMAKDGLTSFISTFQTQTVVAINTVRSTISQIKNIAQNDTTVQAAFYNLANRNLTMYMKAITDKTPNVLSSLKTLLDKIISAIKSKDSDYKNNGINHAKLYIAAIDSYKNNVYNSGVNLVKMVISGILSQADELATYSAKLAKVFSSAFEGQKDEVHDAAIELTNAAVKVFNNRNDDFEECGENAGQGFANGISNKVDEVAKEARRLAHEARVAIEEELDENSPSKVLRQDGQYAGEGFALGLHDKIREVRNAALRVGQSSVDAFGEAIADITDITEDLDPVITPIVDLSDVMKAADSINDLFSKAVTNVNSNVTSASNSMNRKNTTNGLQNIQNDDGSGNTNVTFIQNNNSPKALSRIDIYRQTRNQLAQFREAVERT